MLHLSKLSVCGGVALSCLTGSASANWVKISGPMYVDTMWLNVPDFDQVRALLPGTGLTYCVPTSAMDWMAYISHHGYPSVNPGDHSPWFWWGAVQYNPMTSWIETMAHTVEFLIEQTSLTRLVGMNGLEVFEDFYRETVLNLKGYKVRVAVLPCHKYNYNWVELGVDPAENKILHLKSGRHLQADLSDWLRRLGIE